MADQFIILDEPAITDKRLDSEELTVGGSVVQRERLEICGAAAAEIATVKNTAPASSAYGVTARTIPRKSGSVLTTAALGIDGVYTQAWQETNDDGVQLVQAVARADVASATGGFVIEETDDDTDANFTRTLVSTSVSAATTTWLSTAVRGRKWRVRYTNGGTAQLSFKVTATASV